MKQTLLLIITIISLFTTSCKNKNRFKIDEQIHATEFKIQRFDIDFLKMDTTNIETSIENLYKKYPVFMPVMASEVFGIQSAKNDSVKRMILGFLNDTTFSKVNKNVLEKYKDISLIEKSIASSFSYIKHYFPQIHIPQVYFFVSGFNRSIIITKDFIGIGADMYLGSDYPFYKDVTFEYMTYNMRPESIPTDVISALLFSNFPSDIKADRLLDNMLYRGKIMYILSVIMPEEQSHDIMGYSKFQWEWSRKYEKEIWETIINQNDLYTTDLMQIKKYLNDAPFTSTVSQDSPGRLGTWVGWQIIQSYMDNNKEITLEQLVKNNDYQGILNNSGYNP